MFVQVEKLLDQLFGLFRSLQLEYEATVALIPHGFNPSSSVLEYLSDIERIRRKKVSKQWFYLETLDPDRIKSEMEEIQERIRGLRNKQRGFLTSGWLDARLVKMIDEEVNDLGLEQRLLLPKLTALREVKPTTSVAEIRCIFHDLVSEIVKAKAEIAKRRSQRVAPGKSEAQKAAARAARSSQDEKYRAAMKGVNPAPPKGHRNLGGKKERKASATA